MIKRVLLFALAAGAVIHSAWSLTPYEEQVVDRIAPVGAVCLAGDPCAAGGGGLAGGGAGSPEEIYNTYCTACHATAAVGAPVFGDVEAWAPLIDRGMDSLMANAINGINAMPPMGTCMSCSEDDIRDTITYMLEAAGG